MKQLLLLLCISFCIKSQGQLKFKSVNRSVYFTSRNSDGYKAFMAIRIDSNDKKLLHLNVDSLTAINELINIDTTMSSRFYRALALIEWVNWENFINSVEDTAMRRKIRRDYDKYKKSLER